MKDPNFTKREIQQFTKIYAQTPPYGKYGHCRLKDILTKLKAYPTLLAKFNKFS